MQRTTNILPSLYEGIALIASVFAVLAMFIFIGIPAELERREKAALVDCQQGIAAACKVAASLGGE